VLALTCGTYWLGSRLFNRRVGFISAIWLVTIPNLLKESSLLLPDIPATACVVIGFCILSTLIDRPSKEGSTKTRSYSPWWFFLAGFFFGWAYLVKEYYLLFIFLIPFTFIFFRLPWKRFLLLAAGIAAALSIEAILGLILYGNPLIRLMTAEPRETWGFIERDFLRIVGFFPRLIRQQGGQGSLGLVTIGLIAMIKGLFRKDWKFSFLAVWVFITYGVFTTAGLLPVLFSWEGEVLLRLHKFRYWILILPPLFIAGGAGLEWVIQWLLIRTGSLKKGREIAVSALLGILFIFSMIVAMLGIHDFPNLIRNGADHYLELREFLEDHADRDDLIWINRDSKVGFERILPIYREDFFGGSIWSGETKYLNTDGQYLREDELTEGWIIIDRYFFKTDFQRIPEYLENPPENWVLVFESENKEIAIYEVN
jgi:4-amino-4-deoxy-L-arabinose transferase-like glycosyltransferase